MVGIEHKYFICHCWFYLLHDSLGDAIAGVAFCGGGVTGVGHGESCDHHSDFIYAVRMLLTILCEYTKSCGLSFHIYDEAYLSNSQMFTKKMCKEIT